MRIKIQPLISFQFDSWRGKVVALQMLIVLRVLIVSAFTFVVAVADMNVDMRVPTPVKTAAKLMYFPVYAVTRVLPSLPGSVCAFQNVRRGLGYSPTCIFSVAETNRGGSTDSFGPFVHVFSYFEADWREHLIYSVPVYFMLLNLFAAIYRRGAKAVLLMTKKVRSLG